MLKVHFSDSDNSKQVERELLETLSTLQEIAGAIVSTAWKVPFEDTRGRLFGYADIINNIAGNISDLFEFYKN